MKKHSLLFWTVLLTAAVFLCGCGGNSTGSGSGTSEASLDYTFFPSSPVFPAASLPGDTSEVSSEPTESRPEESLPHSSPEESSQASQVSQVSQASEASAEAPKESSSEPSRDPMTDPSDIEFMDRKHFVLGLPEKELQAFAVLYHSALQFRTEAVLPEPIPENVADRLMWFLNYDCPELIHLKGDYQPLGSDGMISSIRLYYHMTPSEFRHARQKIDSYMQQLKQDARGMTPYEAEKLVFDRIFNTVTFDDYADHAGSVYGALITHHARCEGISKAFMWCLNELGIECMTIAGTPLWDTSSAFFSHSWNVVRLGDNYYHVDLAADNLRTNDGETVLPLYGFFNADDALILRTRTINPIFSDIGVPECHSTDMNYHVRNELLIESGADLKVRFCQILDRNFAVGEINHISIRFDSHDDYLAFLDDWSDWFIDYQERNAYPRCSDIIFFNDVADTVVLSTHP